MRTLQHGKYVSPTTKSRKQPGISTLLTSRKKININLFPEGQKRKLHKVWSFYLEDGLVAIPSNIFQAHENSALFQQLKMLSHTKDDDDAVKEAKS